MRNCSVDRSIAERRLDRSHASVEIRVEPDCMNLHESRAETFLPSRATGRAEAVARPRRASAVAPRDGSEVFCPGCRPQNTLRFAWKVIVNIDELSSKEQMVFRELIEVLE